ncbi:YfiR family protein [bacterium]|nr:YfiR family protein [bacterium]
MGNAQTQEISEYEIKAAFLYNFAKFIEWPEEAFPDMDSPFIFGVLGDDPFSEVLEQTIGSKFIQGRPLEIIRFNNYQDIEYCHILFVGLSENRCVDTILHYVDHLGILTVGDMEGFAEWGGVINFFMEDNKVRLCINPDSAERACLKISSKLLNVSQIVN